MPEAESPSAPERQAEVTCPQCETVLRSVQAGADGQVRCVNCGKRFRLGGANEQVPGAEPEPAPREIPREPASPAYTLVHVLGLLQLIAAGVGCALFLVFALPDILRFFSFRWHELWGLSYVPAGLAAAWSLYYLAASFGRLDRDLVHWAWRRGALDAPLPRPPGSNLPLILPVAVLAGAGGVALAMAGMEDGNFFAALCGLILAGLGLIAGMLFENVYFFLWRQALLAKSLERGATYLPPPTVRPYTFLSFLGIVPLAGCAGASFSTILLVLDNARYNNESETRWGLIGGVGILGVGYSLARLGAILDFAAGAWQGLADRRRLPIRWRDGRNFLLCMIPLAVIPMGLLLDLFLFITEGRFLDNEELVLMFGMNVFFGSACLALYLVLAKLHAWRRAQQAVLEAGGARKLNALPEFGLGYSLLMAAACVCFALGAFTMAGEFFRGMTWRSVDRLVTVFLGMSLFVLGGSYPLVWLSGVVREAAWSVAQAKAARDQLPADIRPEDFPLDGHLPRRAAPAPTAATSKPETAPDAG
ncbi:MAG: hypothetical protein M5U26_28350 [Planctomycetota bacterium]|nr:hypothetical protein [Planctomycetota bacterium]